MGTLFERWVAVMDENTCEFCAERNGNLYLVGQGPMPKIDCPCGENCRCIREPYEVTLEDWWTWLRRKGTPQRLIPEIQ